MAPELLPKIVKKGRRVCKQILKKHCLSQALLTPVFQADTGLQLRQIHLPEVRATGCVGVGLRASHSSEQLLPGAQT